LSTIYPDMSSSCTKYFMLPTCATNSIGISKSSALDLLLAHYACIFRSNSNLLGARGKHQ
jgi:hypothetical protein